MAIRLPDMSDNRMPTVSVKYQLAVVVDVVDGLRGQYDVIEVVVCFTDQSLLQVFPISGEKSGRDFWLELEVEQNVRDGDVLDYLVVVVLKKIICVQAKKERQRKN